MRIDEWEDKVWGRTKCEVDTPYYSRHCLELAAGSYCSVHYHVARANIFEVLRGRVQVITCYAWRHECTIITADNRLLIPAHVPHQFHVIDSGEMIEEYVPLSNGTISNSDIIRLTEGGNTEQVVTGAARFLGGVDVNQTG